MLYLKDSNGVFNIKKGGDSRSRATKLHTFSFPNQRKHLWSRPYLKPFILAHLFLLTVKVVSPKEDPLISPSLTTTTTPVAAIELPVVKVSGIPAELNVGDRVKPSVTVMRADGTTPVEGCPVDFFVVDSLGAMALGARVKTDASGVAEATEYYYVGAPEAGSKIDFIVVTRRVVVP